ncbi:MAG: hypothetical protein RLZZ67_466 [Candidatus Parcubacteria bacterium]|jgi:methionyl-tRNA formyltransferase
MNSHPKFAFFGTPDRAVTALDALKSVGLVPALIITQPDRPQGRKLVMTPPPAKVWAQNEGVPCIQPDNLADSAFIKALTEGNFDIFAVVAYGKILKSEVLNIPKYGALNLHASLLPLLRGSSPIESAILNDMRETGSTIIKMDEKMDHGPILAQRKVALAEWPLPADDLARILVEDGGKLLAEAIIGTVNGAITPLEQDHSKTTLTKKIVKEDGHMDLTADPYTNWLKYNAYKGWPGSFFFVEKEGKQIRVNITNATFENGAFVINTVIPEGKKEVSYKSFK